MNALDLLNDSTKQLSELNSKDSKEYLNIIRETQVILKKELDKKSLNNEDRKYIIDQMMKIAEMTRDMEQDNKNFLAKFGEGHFKTVAMLSASAFTLLGGRTFINKFIDR